MKAGRSILSQSKLRAGLIRMTTAHNKNHSEQIKAMVAGGGNGQSEPALTDDAGKALLGTLLTELLYWKIYVTGCRTSRLPSVSQGSSNAVLDTGSEPGIDSIYPICNLGYFKPKIHKSGCFPTWRTAKCLFSLLSGATWGRTANSKKSNAMTEKPVSCLTFLSLPPATNANT